VIRHNQSDALKRERVGCICFFYDRCYLRRATIRFLFLLAFFWLGGNFPRRQFRRFPSRHSNSIAVTRGAPKKRPKLKTLPSFCQLAHAWLTRSFSRVHHARPATQLADIAGGFSDRGLRTQPRTHSRCGEAVILN